MNIKKRSSGELVALVAEDSGAIRELVCEMLRMRGVSRVIEALLLLTLALSAIWFIRDAQGSSTPVRDLG